MQYSFDIQEAVDYGVDEAIMIWNLRFWILKNKANNKHLHASDDGVNRTWTYNTSEAFTKLFPFWSSRQINHLLKKLIDKNVLLKGNFNANKYNRTSWYCFVDENKMMPSSLVISHFSNLSNGNDNSVKSISQNQEMDFTESGNITDIKPDIKPDNLFSLENIKKYFSENKFKSDSEAFFDYWQQKGWKDGKSKITDPQAAARSWERNYKQKNPEKYINKNKSDLFTIKQSKEIEDLKGVLKTASCQINVLATQHLNFESLEKVGEGFKIKSLSPKSADYVDVLNKYRVKIY